jgi:hypothetical protein
MRISAGALPAVFLVALAVVGGAKPAAGDQPFAPRLRAEQGRYDRTGATLVLDVSQAAAEQPVGRVTFVAPSGQRFKPPQAGMTIGDIAVELVPMRGQPQPSATLTGRLVSAPASRKVAARCVRDPTATLEASLVAAAKGGRPKRLTVRFFVHGSQASTRFTVCLPKPAILPGRSAVRRLAIRLERGLASPRPGKSVWRGLFTPVGAGLVSTTESRGIIVTPSFMTLQVSGAGGSSARRSAELSLGGSLSLNGFQPGRRIRIVSGRTSSSLRVIGRTRTGTLGVYQFRTRAPSRPGAVLFQARAPSREAKGGCRGKQPDAPAGCTSATLGGVSSNIVRIRVR